MQPTHSWLARYAKFVVAYTVLLIFVGAMVTSLDAGMAVPDWPTTFGYNMFTYPISRWKGGIFWEHSHRLVASCLGVLIIILAVWIARVERQRGWVRQLGWAALVIVCAQGIMGGVRVTEISIFWAILHGCTAQMFFCLLVWIAAVLSDSWNRGVAKGISLAHLRSIQAWAWIVTGAVYLQLVLGALVRHKKAWSAIQTFPLNPDGSFFPIGGDYKVNLHFSHRLWAIVVTAVIIVLAVKIFRGARNEKRLVRPAAALLAMLTLQIVFGAMIIFYLRASIPTSVHVINGALILAVSFLLAVRSARLLELAAAEERAAAPAPSGDSLLEGGVR